MLKRLSRTTIQMISLLISAMLALPGGALAEPTAAAVPLALNQAITDGQIPVLSFPVVAKDGHRGVVRLSVETPAQEAKLVPYLATHEPNFTLIAAAKPNSRGEQLEDPLLGLVARVTSLSNVNIALADKFENFPFMRSSEVPVDWRRAVGSYFRNVGGRLRNSVGGVTVSLTIAGMQGSFTYHMSSALPQATIVALASTALNGYQVVYADKWEHFMEKGAVGAVAFGKVAKPLMAKIMGSQVRELSELEKRTLETTGRWAMSMLLNSLSTTFVLYFSNELESPAQVANLANLSTNDTLDSITNERLKLGIISERTARIAGYTRPLLSAAGDISMYSHIPHAIPFMASVMVGTQIYSIFGRELETKVFMPTIRGAVSKAKALKQNVRNKALSCQDFLRRFSAPRVAQTE